jgi:hypothetical protein
MKTLIGGAAAAVLGIIGLAVWWKPFLQLLAGAIPFALLSGGALAIYLGFDELKDTWKSKEEDFGTSSGSSGEVEKYKKEVDDLKKEVEGLKGEKEEKKGKKS